MKLSPFQQGGLDSLCGLYAVVNAVRLSAQPIRLSSESCCELFEVLTGALDAQKKLHKMLIEGLVYPALSHLLHTADLWLKDKFDTSLHYRRPYHTRWPTKSGAINLLAEHLANPRTAAIVGLNHPEGGHWSVASAVTRGGSIVLFDSNKRRLVRGQSQNRSSVRNATELYPRQVFLIWASD